MNPLNLGDSGITVAKTDEVITSASEPSGVTQEYLSGLGDAGGATFQVNFNAGDSQGSTVKLDIFTSLDQGQTWVHVARLAFTTANLVRVFTVSAKTPKTTLYTPATLSDDTVIDGIFGDLWQARKTTAGTYGGSASVSVRMQPHP